MGELVTAMGPTDPESVERIVTPESLWAEIHDLFDTDDGSLPEIRVRFTTSDGPPLGYALLRSRAGACSPDVVEGVANLVASGEAEAFHVVLGGIRSRGVALPELGVFVFEDELVLDYRMGVDWGPSELQALFELLADLVRLDRDASLGLEEGVLTAVAARFQAVWERWNRPSR